ncbi:MAG: M28 family metallopeptidase [Cyclobacteriaceae bacterium]|nr:M28 family metallopeptidase [Cyclobacteriaceae bacterium]MDH5247677.1 M28 family metallopeptidase [Cyclobacteriaceae bacterium]
MDKNNTRIALMLVSIIVAFPLSLRAQVTPAATKAVNSIDPDRIKADMTYLADDLLEGREPGTNGFALASTYVASQFKSIGLTPGVNRTSFVQPVQLLKGAVERKQSSLTLISKGREVNLKFDDDFILNPNLVDLRAEVSVSLVFVGFGVHAPELGYDDYQNIDARNKIVVYFNQAPESFPSNERAYFSSESVKYEEAVSRGAIGVISMQLPGDQRTSWEATVRRSKQGRIYWADKKGKAQNTFEGLKVTVTFNPEKADKLFVNAGQKPDVVIQSLKANKPRSFELNMDARIKVVTTTKAISSSNLIGVVPGSDPVLKNEYVVYAAHLDHFGIGEPVQGDSIYNGAHDNASGTSILLEIARTFKRLEVPPKRSIIIAVVTGEESGLLGSDYFANYPTVRSESIVANFSIDMPFFFHPVLDIVPYGAQHSSLSEPLGVAAKYLNLGIGPDPFPEQVVFIRSDHYSFIRKGIPSLFIKSGFKTTPDDQVDRSISDVAWRKTTYHTPQDDMSQPFNYEGAATHVKINFLTGYLVADKAERPTWKYGDFFGGKFGMKSGTPDQR